MAAPKCRTDYRLESEPLHECGEPPDALIHLDKSVPGHHAFNSAHPVDDRETVLPYYEYKRKQGIVARALFSEEFPMRSWKSSILSSWINSTTALLRR